MLPNPPITGQTARLNTRLVGGPGEVTLVTVVHLNVKPSYAEVHAVERGGASEFIGRSGDPLGLDDSASAEYFPDGTVRLWVCKADDGASGVTTQVRWYDFSAALPPGLHLADYSARGAIKGMAGALVKAVDTVTAALAALKAALAPLTGG